MTLDDDKQCLYVGTSNGLFRLNLKDGSTSHELTPIQLGKCSKKLWGEQGRDKGKKTICG